MNRQPPIEESIVKLLLYELPQLNDEAAAQLVDFLQELVNATENHYSSQLRRYYDNEEQIPLKLPFEYSPQPTVDDR